jgi:hypothetical protein
MSKINVNTWEPETGTAATLMATGDTVTVPSGATLAIASGATITNSGTSTGFGDTTALEDDIALLGFKVAVNGSLAKYNLVDQTEDAFMDATGVDAVASTDALRNASKYYSGFAETISTFNESNSTASTNYTGTIQSYSVPAGSSTLTIEAWGARGGSGYNSWKQAKTTAALSGVGAGEYLGGFGARMKGQFSTSLAGQDIKILVGQPGLGAEGVGATASYGQSSGGGASWVMLDHGVASTAGTTNGAGNSTRYTPLVIAGGGGGASAAQGYGQNQGQTPWTRRGESDASATTSGSASSGTYAFTTAVNGAGGTTYVASGSYYTGGGGGGFLTDGGDTGTTHNDPSEGKGGDSYLNGGLGKAAGSSYGTYNSGFGGGGTANLSGGGAGGGYSGGGGGSGLWAADGMNGGGGGSIINTDYSGATLTATGGTADKESSARDEFGQVVITSGAPSNMTLQSNATTANDGAPTKGDIVLTYTNGVAGAGGVTAINTDLTAEFSADGGTSWTSTTLVAQGNTGTASPHFIVSAHDVTRTSLTGTSMVYRIKTLNQGVAKETRIQAVSLGWS